MRLEEVETIVWELTLDQFHHSDAFNLPESVVFDPVRNLYYVSNVGGNNVVPIDADTMQDAEQGFTVRAEGKESGREEKKNAGHVLTIFCCRCRCCCCRRVPCSGTSGHLAVVPRAKW